MTLTAEPVQRLTVSKETMLRCLLGLMLGIGSVSFIEPSPYEVVFLILVPFIFICGHIFVTRVTMTLFLLVAAFLTSEVISLLPYLWDRPLVSQDEIGATATVYTLQTTYLFVSAMIFAIVFARQTAPRLRVALVAYTISCLIAAGWAMAGYLGIPGFHDTGLIVGRVAGPFKDPNVLGSYCIMGALYLMQSVMNGPPRLRLVNLVVLAITLFGGIFLPLSRGAWGAMIFSALYLGVVTYVTADNLRMRRKLVATAVGLVFIGAAGAALVASDTTLRETVTNRAKLQQDYDGGVTGRFGNQKRSIPMLLERPLGFGPHRFAMYFDLDPHNSYIGAFSSAGWLGGTFFILLVVVTSFLGIRLTLLRTPYMRQAQVIVPALVSAFLQAMQIDVDHWRFVYLMIGAVWGMEAARVAARSRMAHATDAMPLIPATRPPFDRDPRLERAR